MRSIELWSLLLCTYTHPKKFQTDIFQMMTNESGERCEINLFSIKMHISKGILYNAVQLGNQTVNWNYINRHYNDSAYPLAIPIAKQIKFANCHL